MASSGGAVAPAVVWTAISLLFACPIAIYAILAHGFPPALAGRTTSGANALVFVAAFATQWATGLVIEAYPTAPGGGYAVEGHMAGLWGVIVLQTLALAWYGLSGLIRRGEAEG